MRDNVDKSRSEACRAEPQPLGISLRQREEKREEHSRRHSLVLALLSLFYSYLAALTFRRKVVQIREREGR